MTILVDIEKKLGNFTLKSKFKAQNETIALLGASGGGKSVTLKCIAGIIRPDYGRIEINGKLVFDKEKGINLSPQERKVGYLFQNYALFPNMTVEKNIELGLYRKKKKEDKKSLVLKIMEDFSIQNTYGKYPRQLSGGQEQRVALARILIDRPEILMLDEPFSALDSHLRFSLEEGLTELISKYTGTVVLVSHNRDEVYRLADKILVVRDGRVESYEEKHDLFEKPKTTYAARLTGCKNISSLKKLEDGKYLADDWGIEFGINEEINKKNIGIRMQDIKYQRGENLIKCHVDRVIENPFSYVLNLRPLGSCKDNKLFWEMDKNQWENIKNDEVIIGIDNKDLLFLDE